MKTININSNQKKEVINITEKIEQNLPEGEGICHVFLKHTTAALTTADLDPGTDQDILDALNGIIPDLDYRHPHDPSHVGDHILSSIIGTSLSIPFHNKKLILGTWQEAVLLEFNGPRKRNLVLNILK